MLYTLRYYRRRYILNIRGISRRSGVLLGATIFIISVTATSFVRIQNVSAFTSGDGSESSPYQIESCNDLQNIADDLDAYYVLNRNVDCDGIIMTRIGHFENPFTGSLKGNGYTISNVILTNDSYDTGIFGRTDTATFSDLYLDNIEITGTDNVGALVGTSSYTTISHVGLTNATINGTGEYAGGIVGYLGGSSIEKSFVERTTISGDTYVGGLAGVTIGPSTISQSYFQGTVDGDTKVGGITGQVGAGPAYVSETYADVVFENAGTDVVGATDFGASVMSSFIASAPYAGNKTQSPLDTWDFTDTWYVRTENYPGLKPLRLPILLCEMPTSTDTSVTVTCTTEPGLEGPTSWEIAYKYSDDTTWAPLPSKSGDLFTTTVQNLLPGTSYNVRFRYTNDIGTSVWGSQEITTTGNSDIDGDGISNKEEFTGPNNGDADNDGVLDYTQANVTSLKGVNANTYVVLKTTCNDNFNVRIGRESSESADIAFDYPAGLVGFVARGCQVGGVADISLYFYDQSSTGLTLRKSFDNTYRTITDASTQQIVIDNNSVVKASYKVVDGGGLDDDGVADGNIVDPVGLALNVIGVPNTGL